MEKMCLFQPNNIFYFSNETHYLDELSQKDNYKVFKDKIENLKVNFKYNLLIFSSIFLILLTFIPYYFLCINIKAFYLYFIFIFFSFIYYFIFNKIISNFDDCYNNFIKLCEIIVKYENIIKNKLRIKLYIPEISEILQSNLPKMKNSIDKYINDGNFISESTINSTKNVNNLFNDYLKSKTKLFKYISDKYRIEFIVKELYIKIYLKFILVSQNNLNSKLKLIIMDYEKCIKEVTENDQNYDTIIKGLEKYVNNKIINIDYIKKNEMINNFYNLLLNNCKLNEIFIEIINNLQNERKDNEKINNLIETIIDKKQISINILKKLQNNFDNNESEVNDKEIHINDNKILPQNIVKNNKNINDDENQDKIKKTKNNISLLEIEAGKFNNNNEKINDENFDGKKQNKETNTISCYELINEENKIKNLKADFISELNEYCKKMNKKNNIKEDEEKEEETKNNNSLTLDKLLEDENEEKEIENEENEDFAKKKLDFKNTLNAIFAKKNEFNSIKENIEK